LSSASWFCRSCCRCSRPARLSNRRTGQVFKDSGVQALGVGRWALGARNRGLGVGSSPATQRPTPNAQRRSRLRSGFTLVEVLVVMIILAILAAVVVPRVVGRTEDARRARGVSDVESLGT